MIPPISRPLAWPRGMRRSLSAVQPKNGAPYKHSPSDWGNGIGRHSSGNEKSLENTMFSRLFSRGGDKEDRTPDLLNAIQALSQLSYTPTCLLFAVSFYTIAQASGFVKQKTRRSFTFLRKNKRVPFWHLPGVPASGLPELRSRENPPHAACAAVPGDRSNAGGAGRPSAARGRSPLPS